MTRHFAVSAVVTLLWSGIAAAGTIVATTGQVQEIVPPPGYSVVPPDNASNVDVHLFAERVDLPLPNDIDVDMTTPYTVYDPPTGRTAGTILAGTVVNSYYLHFDPVGSAGAVGSVTFAEPILGVIAEGDDACCSAIDTLGPSNIVGNPNVIYPDNDDLLGIEDSPDKLTLYPATLKILFGAASPGDRVRILTAATGTLSPCGNGVIEGPGEQCDDGDVVAGDGCDNACQLEGCFECSGEPSSCTQTIFTCANDDGCCLASCTAANDNDCIPPPNKCLKGKIKCVSKVKSCLLKEEEKARKSGTAPDALKMQRCKNKFDGGPDQSDLAPKKGCFPKLEAVNKGPCLTFGDATKLEDMIDAFILDVLADIDLNPADDLNGCTAGKIKCVSKKDACILKVHQKAANLGLPPDQAKLQTCFDKFDGGADPTNGCFAKLEANDGGCLTTGDTAAIETKIDDFDEDVVNTLLGAP